jgi:CheY-like chemotaxis protein
MKNKSTQAAKYKKVLLVDDNEIDNFINERMITSSGFAEKVIVKTSSDDAIKYLLDNQEQEDQLPEIVFLDLNMPVKDGFTFLEDFKKANEQVRNKCKVVVLSSSISPDDINKASTDRHVFKYVNKPLSEKYLDAINI